MANELIRFHKKNQPLIGLVDLNANSTQTSIALRIPFEVAFLRAERALLSDDSQIAMEVAQRNQVWLILRRHKRSQNRILTRTNLQILNATNHSLASITF